MILAEAAGLDTFTLSLGALTLIASTAAAWGTLRANVKANAAALLNLEQEVRRIVTEEVKPVGDRLHAIELRFERSKGREEGRFNKGHTLTETREFKK